MSFCKVTEKLVLFDDGLNLKLKHLACLYLPHFENMISRLDSFSDLFDRPHFERFPLVQ